MLFSFSLEYVLDTFHLVWRCQTGKDGEEEILLDPHSTGTLYEMGMQEEPSKTYLLIREKDENPPQRQDKVSCSGIILCF